MNKNTIQYLIIIVLLIIILCIFFYNYNKYEHLTNNSIHNDDELNKIKILKYRINNIIEKNNSIEFSHISKIINIYQQQYNNSKCQGLGDFIRGSYFVIQFAKKFNIQYEIIINHPIAGYLKTSQCSNYESINNVNYISPFALIHTINNYIMHEYIEEYNKNKVSEIIQKFKDKINKEYDNNKNNNVYFFTNQYPIYKIQEDEKKIMREIFEPNDLMKSYIDENLNNLDLIKKEYIVVHFRTGDKYLIDGNVMNYDKYNILISEINTIKDEHKNSKIIIISDNQALKNHLKNNVKDIHLFDNKITHLGENQILDDEKVKDTLLDFYIINNSKQVYSFTRYRHGSGFVQWNCITYNIPYTIKYIHNL